MRVYTITHRIEEDIYSTDDIVRMSDAKLDASQSVLEAISDTLIFLSIEGIKKYILSQGLTLDDNSLEYLKKLELGKDRLIIIYPFKWSENYTESKRYIIMLKETND